MFEKSDLNKLLRIWSQRSRAIIWAPDLCDKNCCGVVITNQRVLLCGGGGHKGWKCLQLKEQKEKVTILLVTILSPSTGSVDGEQCEVL